MCPWEFLPFPPVMYSLNPQISSPYPVPYVSHDNAAQSSAPLSVHCCASAHKKQTGSAHSHSHTSLRQAPGRPSSQCRRLTTPVLSYIFLQSQFSRTKKQKKSRKTQDSIKSGSLVLFNDRMVRPSNRAELSIQLY